MCIHHHSEKRADGPTAALRHPRHFAFCPFFSVPALGSYQRLSSCTAARLHCYLRNGRSLSPQQPLSPLHWSCPFADAAVRRQKMLSSHNPTAATGHPHLHIFRNSRTPHAPRLTPDRSHVPAPSSALAAPVTSPFCCFCISPQITMQSPLRPLAKQLAALPSLLQHACVLCRMPAIRPRDAPQLPAFCTLTLTPSVYRIQHLSPW